MTRRLQGLPLDPSGSTVQPVLQEPVQLRARGRLGLPLEIVKRVSWLAGQTAEVNFALAILNEPGQIALRSWESEAQPILAERKRLIQAEEYETLRMLEDRYRRIQVAKDGRVTLTLTHILHLGLPVHDDAYVFVSLVGKGIEIMSPAYRDHQIKRASAAFPDLP
jgi:hypothetical protein